MDTVLGLLGVALFIPCVITLAAAMTWVVVKVFPTSKEEKPKPADTSS